MMPEQLSGDPQLTLFELTPLQAQDAPRLPTPVATAEAAPTAEPVRSPPRRRYRPLRGGTFERIDHLLAWMAREDQETEPMPEGVAIYPPIYQLKITLRGIRPPIWRRVLVPANVTLARLHRIIQNSMGWWNDHLYSFNVGDWQYSDEGFDLGFRQAAGRRLFELDLRPRDRFTYSYDFGDDWRHEILLERVVPSDPDEHYPVCIDGARACPPEDCGGVGGYEELLQVLDDPTHEQHDSMLDWVGGKYDPDWFDLEVANFGFRRAPVHEAKSTRDRTLAWRAQQFIQQRARRRPYQDRQIGSASPR